jgi:predicted ATPase/class 3 adenylate cyclase
MTCRLPTGTVTFLFTDVEGSTRLLDELGSERYADALAEHRRVLRDSFAAHAGVEVDTQGDAFFVAFPTAEGAVAAARQAQQALQTGPLRVRMGLHTGTPLVTAEGYVGPDVHRAARIAAAGHGGQVVLSEATRGLVDGIELRPLGEHRLKDLAEPLVLYQLGDEAFAPLKSLHRTNLPVPATVFLGRDDELGDVAGLLGRPDVRLLTLTGPGGTGKTRLALQAAAESSDAYPDGVFWVPLAPVRDPELVASTIEAAVGARGDLAGHLRGRRLLLLLDNFEHVIGAAAALSALVAECPQLTVLVTSRERLQLAAEREYQVPPLEPADGVALFVARTEALGVIPAVDGAVAELCERLDNLPLAIELAAAHAKLYSPQQLVERLGRRLDLLKGGRDADPRQQTLRATIEWSYELLDDKERELFARLSVFAGGCSLESAEMVCDADPDVLLSLIDKSLVRRRDAPGGPRFWMLETIREYAGERLRALGVEDEFRARHAKHFLALAETGMNDLGEPREAIWQVRLDDELDNCRVAITTLLEGAGDRALRLVRRIWAIWLGRGQLDEGERWITLALGESADAPGPERAWMLGVLGEFPRFRGEHERALAIKEEAVSMTRSLGLESETKALLSDMAETLAYLGELDRARALVAEALDLEARQGDAWPYRARAAAAEVALVAGDYEEARRVYEWMLDPERVRKHETVYVWALSSYAVCLRRLGDEAAAGTLCEALAAARESGLLVWLADVLEDAAALVAAEGPQAAAIVLGSADAVRAATGYGRLVPAVYDDVAASLRRRLGDREYEALLSEGMVMSSSDAIAYAEDILARAESGRASID